MQLVQHIVACVHWTHDDRWWVNCGRCLGCMERERWTPPPTHGVTISQPQMA